ncbi:MAG: putative amidohydrolase YtcJ [Halioglobus sp.]
MSDLILRGASVYTLDPQKPWADAVAIANNTIIAVGSEQEISAYRSATTRIMDLDNAMVLPGFHDAHMHPLEGGFLQQYCDLSEATESVEAVTTKIRECAEESDQEWIIGFGIDLSLFPQNGPDRALLDDIAPQRLMFLDASDGHSAWVNSAVLALAHIDDSTADPAGGVIERRPGSTAPNGTLREVARDLADSLRPPREHQESTQAMREAIRLINAAGITSLIDAWSSELEMKVYKAIDDAGDLSVRVRNSITDEGVFEKDTGADFERVLSIRSQFESERISTGSIKMFVDGVMEGETAALVEPYVELGHTGFLNYSEAELFSRVTRYEAMGLQIHMHAMGDGAARAGLNAIEYAREQNIDNPRSQDLRHHMSHLQLVHPDDINRFATLGVAANFTGAWAYPDKWVTELNLPVLGSARVDRMYPMGSIVRAGGVVVGGSDWIYGPLNPLESIEVSITRQDPNDSEAPPGNVADALDLEMALRAYTINAAWLMHQEKSVGSIEVGKRADLVILDRNLFEIPTTEISEAKVQFTLFDGEIVYRAPQEN